MRRNYRNYTDEELIEAVKNSFSIAGVLRNLNLIVAGGNYYTIKKEMQRLELNTEHFTGQAWNKNDQLKDWKNYTKTTQVKKHLIKERGHCCEECNQSEWRNQIIPLEIHHMDGDRTNNSLDNLQLLCCNCHALTDNWRSRNQEKVEPTWCKCPNCGGKKQWKSIMCQICRNEQKKNKSQAKLVENDCYPESETCTCGSRKTNGANTCIDCYDANRKTKIEWPSIAEMTKLVFEKSTSQLAKDLGVSDKAVDKFCKKNNIPKPPRGYWAKFKFGKISGP